MTSTVTQEVVEIYKMYIFCVVINKNSCIFYGVRNVVFWLKLHEYFSGTCEHKLAITDCFLNSTSLEVYAEIGLTCVLFTKIVPRRGGHRGFGLHLEILSTSASA